MVCSIKPWFGALDFAGNINCIKGPLWPSGCDGHLANMKCTIIVLGSWVSILVQLNLGCVILLAKSYLNHKYSFMAEEGVHYDNDL